MGRLGILGTSWGRHGPSLARLGGVGARQKGGSTKRRPTDVFSPGFPGSPTFSLTDARFAALSVIPTTTHHHPLPHTPPNPTHPHPTYTPNPDPHPPPHLPTPPTPLSPSLPHPAKVGATVTFESPLFGPGKLKSERHRDISFLFLRVTVTFRFRFRKSP